VNEEKAPAPQTIAPATIPGQEGFGLTPTAPTTPKPLRKFYIATYGNACLGPVDSIDHVLCSLSEAPKAIEDLKAVAAILGAAGFAANQLGYSVRVMIVRLNDGNLEIMQNPVLSSIEGSQLTSAREHCFSIPEFSALVLRPNEVRIEYMTEDGQTRRGGLSGPEARYAQHEYDHLEGKLISAYGPFGRESLKRIQRRFKPYGHCYSVNELGQFDFQPRPPREF